MFRFHAVTFFALCVCSAESAQVADEGYTREQLQPLTKFRQQHRRTTDGRLCAAAFVQNRKAYTGCTEAPNPNGESGRPWCYVEPQVALLLLAATFFARVRSSHSSWVAPPLGTTAVRSVTSQDCWDEAVFALQLLARAYIFRETPCSYHRISLDVA